MSDKIWMTYNQKDEDAIRDAGRTLQKYMVVLSKQSLPIKCGYLLSTMPVPNDGIAGKYSGNKDVVLIDFTNTKAAHEDILNTLKKSNVKILESYEYLTSGDECFRLLISFNTIPKG